MPDQVTRSLLAHGEQQLELLGEELVVVAQVVAEERERLDERAAARHDLGAAAGEQVERREVLEDAHGSSELSTLDRARRAGCARALGGRREHDGGRRDGEVGAVVLADAEDVEPDLVGELDLLDQVAQPLGGADDPARHRVGRQLREGVDAELETISLHTQGNVPAKVSLPREPPNTSSRGRASCQTAR